MSHIKKLINMTLLLSLSFLTACGSGGTVPNNNGSKPTSVPSSPINVQAESGDQVNTLNWDTVSDAESYTLYWSTVSNTGVNGNKISLTSNTYEHIKLINDTIYYYVITATNSIGESETSTEIASIPTRPYATELFPFDLGNAPLAAYNEIIPNTGRRFHYTLNAAAGATYMFYINNVVDSAQLHVFSENDWDEFGVNVLCSDFRFSTGKQTVHCIATAPANGIFYLRIGTTESNVENVTLKVDQVINQGSMAAIELGTAPTTPVAGTVLELGESIYQVNVTSGKPYRVMLNQWFDSEAAFSRLNLYVFDGAYTTLDATNRLCIDYGGNSEVTQKFRLPIIHCLARPTQANYITIVTQETQYGKGATYDIQVKDALIEGSSASPVLLTGDTDTIVYHGEVTAASAFSIGNSYYQLSMTPNTNYMVDLRGMHETNDLIITDASFTTGICNSRESNLLDESCNVISDSSGNIYAMVAGDTGKTDTFVLSSLPAPTGAIVPARYPDEGTRDSPILLGNIPITTRNSTVGAGNSYYAIDVTPGSSLGFSIRRMNADVDLSLHVDANYQNRICVSKASNTDNENCTITVPDFVNTIFIKTDGQFTTNNGSGSSATEFDVGAMFQMSIERIMDNR